MTPSQPRIGQINAKLICDFLFKIRMSVSQTRPLTSALPHAPPQLGLI
jgi:hypothetical protein